MKAARGVGVIVVLAALAAGVLLAVSPPARQRALLLSWQLRSAPIGTVLRNAAEDDLLIVQGRIVGEVAAPLAHRSAFVLDDGTGAVRVVTDAKVPAKGTTVLVRGRLRRTPGLFGTEVTGDVTLEAVELLAP